MSKKYYGRKRTYPSFKGAFENFANETPERLLAIVKMSINDLVENAQTPGPSLSGAGKGGRMRVDTGFLRASGAASLNSIPSGPSERQTDVRHAYDDGNKPISPTVESALTSLTIGAKFYFGWTANYAKYREVYDGFLEGAIQHWPRIVAYNAAILRDEV